MTEPANIMQKLFDALPSPDAPPSKMLTAEELAVTLHFSSRMVVNALDRLRRMRCVRSSHIDGVWRYGRCSGARRPADSRGKRKR